MVYSHLFQDQGMEKTVAVPNKNKQVQHEITVSVQSQILSNAVGVLALITSVILVF